MQKNIFTDTLSFLYTIVFLTFISFFFNGCENKKNEKPLIPVENTTEIFTPKDLQIQAKKSKQKNRPHPPLPETKTPINDKSDRFIVKEKEDTHEIIVINGLPVFKDIDKPMVLLNLFQNDCRMCKTYIKSLTKLDKKYKKELQLINLFDDTERGDNVRFIKRILTKLKLDSELTLPLSILYTNGYDYRYYEGLIPVEMLEYDIQQANKK